MNFNITHNWLLEYIDTDATPEEIQNFLSLSAVNVETLEKVGDNVVYDIEVTSNRIDAASVIGFAQECVAVLPHHGKKTTWKHNPLTKSLKDIAHKIDKTQTAEAKARKPNEATNTHTPDRELKITVKDADTISRITAVILSGIHVGPSPDIIKQRLEACGERSINNVVDISNYLRITLGQPVHIFDYDSIKAATITIEKSQKGDIVTLIDGKELKLPGNDVIIKDGEGRIIDLVGLMGGQNTGVTDSTKNILLFIPIVNKTLVRRTSMTTGHRTPAISYFEKGLDEERTEPTCTLGVEMLQEHAQAQVASRIYDIYPKKSQKVHLSVSLSYLNALMNTKLAINDIADMISPLGFTVESTGEDTMKVDVPSWRRKDVDSQADIAEEVARVYGYHNIEPHIQKTDPVYQPLDVHNLFDAKEKVRNYLAAVGYNEQYNYSMVSEKMIKAYKQDPADFLKLTDTISTDIEYMRRHLIPSLLKNITDNQGRYEHLRFFELARVYKKRDGELPREDERLTLVTYDDFATLKGTLENILGVLNIEGVSFENYDKAAESSIQVQLVHPDAEGNLGHVGLLRESYMMSHGIKKPVCAAELRFAELVKFINPHPKYVKPNPHAHIKLDVTYTSDKNHVFAEIRDAAFKTSDLLQSIDVIDQYEDQVTLRLTFAAEDRNITEAEAKEELEKIKTLR